MIEIAGGRRTTATITANAQTDSPMPYYQMDWSWRRADSAAVAFIAATDRQKKPDFAIVRNNFCAFLF